MQVFFQKYPVVLKEITAIKMMHKLIEQAEDKCKDKDETYMNDLALVHDMLETYFGEKGVNPTSLL